MQSGERWNCCKLISIAADDIFNFHIASLSFRNISLHISKIWFGAYRLFPSQPFFSPVLWNVIRVVSLKSIWGTTNVHFWMSFFLFFLVYSSSEANLHFRVALLFHLPKASKIQLLLLPPWCMWTVHTRC